MTLLAEAVRALDDVSAAAVLYDGLLPHAATFSFVSGVTTGCTAHYLGVLATMTGRFPEADDHFAFATPVCEQIGAPAHLGRCRIEWARMLLVRRHAGELERARQLLDQALAAAAESHLVSVDRRARGLMETAL